ncbi:MAG: efflux RND transporter periplasmic adaptor subunit [Planctomycetota bacterium]|nr:efflux RND transporter periplasmic adaptor subunit [Planctomycetota bacterium]
MKSAPHFFFVGYTALLPFGAGCKKTVSLPKSSESAERLVKVKTVVVVQKEVTKSTKQPATIVPYYETQINSKVEGYISEVNVDMGDVVKAGQSLARIDVPEMQSQRDAALARVDLLQAKEKEASAGVVLAKATVQAAKARLEQARSQLLEKEALFAAADAEFNRTQDLVRRGSLQERLLDEATKNRESAKASQAAVLSSVQSAQAEVGVAEAKQIGTVALFESATAETQVARKQLEELEVMLGYANITAPFDGVISARHANLGELMGGDSSNGKSLFVLESTSVVRVQVAIPEVQAPFVQVGDKLTLEFPSFASEPPVEVAVTRLSVSLDQGTRTLLVEAELQNDAGKFLPGMFGQATLTLQTEQVAMLPARAVRFDESGNAYVYLVNQDSEVETKEVAVGIDTGTEIEIVSGVEVGQQVIGAHLSRFVDGQKVESL